MQNIKQVQECRTAGARHGRQQRGDKVRFAKESAIGSAFVPRPRGIPPAEPLVGLRFWALLAAFAALMTAGCGTTHATLDIAAPPTATAGVPFTITVTAMYAGERDTVINSFIHFTSSDSAAVLPSDYLFTPTDAGSHTWTKGITLMTPGSQTITATILNATGINGTVDVRVSSASFTDRE